MKKILLSALFMSIVSMTVFSGDYEPMSRQKYTQIYSSLVQKYYNGNLIVTQPDDVIAWVLKDDVKSELSRRRVKQGLKPYRPEYGPVITNAIFRYLDIDPAYNLPAQDVEELFAMDGVQAQPVVEEADVMKLLVPTPLQNAERLAANGIVHSVGQSAEANNMPRVQKVEESAASRASIVPAPPAFSAPSAEMLAVHGPRQVKQERVERAHHQPEAVAKKGVAFNAADLQHAGNKLKPVKRRVAEEGAGGGKMPEAKKQSQAAQGRLALTDLNLNQARQGLKRVSQTTKDEASSGNYMQQALNARREALGDDEASETEDSDDDSNWEEE